MVLSAYADLWWLDELDAAVRAVTGPFNSVEDKRDAHAKYYAVMQARLDSDYRLPDEPL
jgi:hypothetical protein